MEPLGPGEGLSAPPNALGMASSGGFQAVDPEGACLRQPWARRHRDQTTPSAQLLHYRWSW
jgi:hypothetical protein